MNVVICIPECEHKFAVKDREGNLICRFCGVEVKE